jgi:hypothetical protein
VEDIKDLAKKAYLDIEEAKWWLRELQERLPRKYRGDIEIPIIWLLNKAWDSIASIVHDFF